MVLDTSRTIDVYRGVYSSIALRLAPNKTGQPAGTCRGGVRRKSDLLSPFVSFLF
jgi:hypothetical protein